MLTAYLQMESFVSVLWPHDPKIWTTRIGPTGSLERTLLEDWTAPLPAYLSEADKQTIISTFRANGFTAPFCWYKSNVRGLASVDDASKAYCSSSHDAHADGPIEIPAERAYPPAGVPIFYGAAKHDHIGLASIGFEAFKDEHFAEGQVTEKEYDADHWLIISQASEIGHDLEAWVEGFTN